VTYAMLLNVFFILLELFTALYSQIPEHVEHFEYLYLGLHGQTTLVPWMWTSSVLAVASLVVLLVPALRHRESWLAVTCAMVFASLWIDKGLGLIVGGFVPSPLGAVTNYVPTVLEVLIVLGIWALGFLMVTVFYKIALSVREEVAA
jgi:Ni/Fe-hydrogenase subunit HybB-like protein